MTTKAKSETTAGMSAKAASVMHALSWIAGALCLITPFFQYWPMYYGGLEFYFRQGAGYFGDNLMIVSALAVIGAALGGAWWRLLSGLKREKVGVLSGFAVTVFALSIAAFFSEDWSHKIISQLVPVVALAGLVYAFIGIKAVQFKKALIQSPKESLCKKFSWNGSYFVTLFILFIVNNVFAILTTDNSWGEITSALIGRVFFYLAVMAWVSVVAYGLQSLTHKSLRFLPWLLWGLIPWIVIAETWLSVVMGRQLRELLNGMTSSGEFDLTRELHAGGFKDVPESYVLWILVAFVFFSALVVYSQSRLSRKLQFKASGLQLVIFGVITSILAVAEQGIGSTWKRVGAWQAEYKALSLHFGIFTPPRGVGNYTVEFYQYAQAEPQEVKIQNAPDIHILMIESMRADAVSQEVTPFLYRFSNEECQPIGTSWAGSNATHLAWYSVMHSQVPVFWKGALESVVDRDNYMGPTALKWLKKAGYDLEVRAVCDLGYKDFGLLNFGTDTKLVDALEQSVDGTDFADCNIPEREVITFDRLMKSIESKPAGKGFYFTALDSPHYGYYWHSDFKPPFAEYIPSAKFPVGPSDEEVKLYWNRYLNSCAWIDHQIAAFCEKLKKAGRYDNSIIIVTGDHGEEFQERGRWCHCSSVHPEQTQVPMFIKWPKSVGRGPEKSVAGHLDVMPSLLGYMGASKETLDQFAGQNLLSEGQHTVITTTSYAGTSGETMVLRRGDYAAYFSWPHYWLADIPEEMSLEFLEHMGQKVTLGSADEYLAKLREVFPDAFDRYIKTMEVKGR